MNHASELGLLIIFFAIASTQGAATFNSTGACVYTSSFSDTNIQHGPQLIADCLANYCSGYPYFGLGPSSVCMCMSVAILAAATNDTNCASCAGINTEYMCGTVDMVVDVYLIIQISTVKTQTVSTTTTTTTKPPTTTSTLRTTTTALTTLITTSTMATTSTQITTTSGPKTTTTTVQTSTVAPTTTLQATTTTTNALTTTPQSTSIESSSAYKTSTVQYKTISPQISTTTETTLAQTTTTPSMTTKLRTPLTNLVSTAVETSTFNTTAETTALAPTSVQTTTTSYSTISLTTTADLPITTSISTSIANTTFSTTTTSLLESTTINSTMNSKTTSTTVPQTTTTQTATAITSTPTSNTITATNLSTTTDSTTKSAITDYSTTNATIKTTTDILTTNITASNSASTTPSTNSSVTSSATSSLATTFSYLTTQVKTVNASVTATGISSLVTQLTNSSVSTTNSSTSDAVSISPTKTTLLKDPASATTNSLSNTATPNTTTSATTVGTATQVAIQSSTNLNSSIATSKVNSDPTTFFSDRSVTDVTSIEICKQSVCVLTFDFGKTQFQFGPQKFNDCSLLCSLYPYFGLGRNSECLCMTEDVLAASYEIDSCSMCRKKNVDKMCGMIDKAVAVYQCPKDATTTSTSATKFITTSFISELYRTTSYYSQTAYSLSTTNAFVQSTTLSTTDPYISTLSDQSSLLLDSSTQMTTAIDISMKVSNNIYTNSTLQITPEYSNNYNFVSSTLSLSPSLSSSPSSPSSSSSSSSSTLFSSISSSTTPSSTSSSSIPTSFSSSTPLSSVSTISSSSLSSSSISLFIPSLYTSSYISSKEYAQTTYGFLSMASALVQDTQVPSTLSPTNYDITTLLDRSSLLSDVSSKMTTVSESTIDISTTMSSSTPLTSVFTISPSSMSASSFPSSSFTSKKALSQTKYGLSTTSALVQSTTLPIILSSSNKYTSTLSDQSSFLADSSTKMTTVGESSVDTSTKASSNIYTDSTLPSTPNYRTNVDFVSSFLTRSPSSSSTLFSRTPSSSSSALLLTTMSSSTPLPIVSSISSSLFLFTSSPALTSSSISTIENVPISMVLYSKVSKNKISDDISTPATSIKNEYLNTIFTSTATSASDAEATESAVILTSTVLENDSSILTTTSKLLSILLAPFYLKAKQNVFIKAIKLPQNDNTEPPVHSTMETTTETNAISETHSQQLSTQTTEASVVVTSSIQSASTTSKEDNNTTTSLQETVVPKASNFVRGFLSLLSNNMETNEDTTFIQVRVPKLFDSIRKLPQPASNMKSNSNLNYSENRLNGSATNPWNNICIENKFVQDSCEDGLAIKTTISATVPFMTAGLNDSMKYDIGYKLEDMVCSCSFLGQPCQRDDFSYWYDETYGNCFTYNFRPDPRKVLQAGNTNGLRLILKLDPSTYMCTSESVGFKMVIHEHNLTSIPDAEGYTLPAGFTNIIGVSKTNIFRASGLYGDCVLEFGGPEYPNRTYSVENCYRNCFQSFMNQYCGCYDPKYFSPTNGNYCTFDEKKCLDTARSCDAVLTSEKCGCKKRCRDAIFGVILTDSTILKGISEQCCNMNPNESTCGAQQKEIRSYVEVFYETVSQIQYVEVPAYTLSNLISDSSNIGGILLGMGVISCVELAFFVVFIILVLTKASSAATNTKSSKANNSVFNDFKLK